MCLLILSINGKRRGKEDGTPTDHFQGLFISRKMKYVMAFKKHISHETKSQKTLMLASFAIARPAPEVKALQRGFKLAPYGWSIFPIHQLFTRKESKDPFLVSQGPVSQSPEILIQ